jgi:type IV pilus assembly protein PilW
MKSPRSSRSAGFTLVELMVSVTIGLLLTVAVAQLFIGSRKSYATTDDMARMQENMRFTYDVLSRTARMAGYMAYGGNSAVDVDGAVGMGIFGLTNLALDGTDGNASLTDVSTPDTLKIAYQGTGDIAGTPDGATTDCLGTPIGTLTTAINIFSVGPDPVTKTPALLCRTSPDGPDVAIITDVENMQILYGEETNGDFTADRYVPRHMVTDIDRVMSLRIALLFRTPNLQVRSTPDTATYKLHGGTLPAKTGPEATRIRRVMTVTVALRNRSP